MSSKKVVISGYYGFDNFGDDAILSVLCEKLKSLSADITVISANPQKTAKDFLVNSVKNFDLPNLLKTISDSEILISGGGSLLQDVTSLKSLLYYSFVLFSALVMRKDVIIFAQGIGPLNRRISKLLVKSILQHAKFVSVRDEKSQALLADWNINAKLVNDPVFSLSIQEIPKNFAIGVQLREFSTMNDAFLVSLAQFLLKDFPNRKIELFIFQKALDERVCKKFANIVKSQNPHVEVELIYYENRTEIFKRIAQLDYMFAMRFHAVIAAIKAGVKTAAIDYDIKVQRLAEEASIPLISLMAEENDFNAIFDSIKSLSPARLSDFANSKQFDWSEIETLFL